MSATFSRWVKIYNVPMNKVSAVEEAADEGWSFEYALDEDWGWDEEEQEDGTAHLNEDDRELTLSARTIGHNAGGWLIATDVWQAAGCYCAVDVRWESREWDKADDEHYYTEAEYQSWQANTAYLPVRCNANCDSPYTSSHDDAPR